MKNGLLGSLAFVGGVLVLTAVAAFVVMWAAGIGIFSAKVNAVVAKRALGARVTTAIYQPENAITNYEQFHNECRDIVAKGEQITNLRVRYNAALAAAKTDDPFGQKAQAAQDALADLTGAENLRAQEAQAYNSQSAQYTRAAFKDVALPDRIDPPYANIVCG